VCLSVYGKRIGTKIPKGRTNWEPLMNWVQVENRRTVSLTQGTFKTYTCIALLVSWCPATRAGWAHSYVVTVETSRHLQAGHTHIRSYHGNLATLQTRHTHLRSYGGNLATRAGKAHLFT
jgi:hypothetical protein